MSQNHRCATPAIDPTKKPSLFEVPNICIDLGKPTAVNRQPVLRPDAMMFLALHWPCEGPGCANNGIGHQH
jgi:hypothetical protein